jgi:Secretion system C-terminal sorting domain/Outer membrane protein Omp28
MKLKSILLMASASLMFTNSFGQHHVTTGPTNHYVLLEEATGTWCGYCVDGAQDIEEKIEPTYSKAICVSWHNADPMTVTGDPFNAATPSGTGYITGFPMGTVDRAVIGGNVGQSRPWDSKVSARVALTPNFQVDMTSLYVPGTRTLTVTVTAKALVALTGDWRINGLVIEDSIASGTSSLYNQHNYAGPPVNYFTTACTGSHSWFDGSGNPIMPTTNYAHMNVVEKILGANIWGDVAFTNPTAGTVVSKTYTYVLPAAVNPTFTKVVGLVQKYGATTTDRVIENSILARVRWMPAVTTSTANLTKAMQGVNVYPNPARNYVTVTGTLEGSSETNITIMNAVGQVVVEKQFPAGGSLFSETLQLNNLSNGLYFVNIANNGEVVTKQFTIAK